MSRILYHTKDQLA